MVEPSGLVERAIVAFLDRAQARDLRKDEGHGYRSARLVGLAVGLDKAQARAALEKLAANGRLRREQSCNALMWRSIKPLPWEGGGSLVMARAAEAEAWKQPLTLIVQAGVGDLWRDVKAYPAALRERAEAHVRLENAAAAYRRDRDRHDDCHLRSGYKPPPTFRLVLLDAPVPHGGQANG